MLQFTERGRAVVEAAEARARAEGFPAVAVGHLALALLDLDNGVAHMALLARGTRIERLRDAVVAATGAGRAEAEDGDLRRPRVPFAPQARALLEAAAREANSMGQQYLGTEHLLMALAATDDPAGDVFRSAGITRETVRQAVREVLGSA